MEKTSLARTNACSHAGNECPEGSDGAGVLTQESHTARMERIVTQSSLYGPQLTSPACFPLTRMAKVPQLVPADDAANVTDNIKTTPVLRTSEDRTPSPPQPSPSMRILIAEDNKINQMVARKVLWHVLPDCAIDVVENGEEVLLAVANNPKYDLILMDIHMPKMDGLEAARRVRAMCSPSLSPRIVALSADTLKSVHQQCRAVGIDEFISKPFRVNDMRRILQSRET